MDNSTPQMSEKLVQYLDNELTGIEKNSLEQQLASDKFLQDELDSLKATREAVRLYGLQQKIAGLHESMMKELQPSIKKINSVRRMARYSIAVAASVILIVGGIFAYNFYTLSADKVFTSNYQSYELSTLRDNNNIELSSIEKAYREKKYKAVTVFYEQNGSASIQETFLAAMSYIEMGNNIKPVNEFKKIIDENERLKTNLLKDEAEYYLSLVYLRNGDYDFALELMQQIKDNSSHLYHEKITSKLIRRVKMLKWR